MAKEIGRLNAFALGSETTAGTAGTIDTWIPVESANLKPMVEIVKDESGFNTIAAPADAHMAKVWSEFQAKGNVRPTSFGWVLWGTLGTVSSPTLLPAPLVNKTWILENN